MLYSQKIYIFGTIELRCFLERSHFDGTSARRHDRFFGAALLSFWGLIIDIYIYIYKYKSYDF